MMLNGAKLDRLHGRKPMDDIRNICSLYGTLTVFHV